MVSLLESFALVGPVRCGFCPWRGVILPARSFCETALFRERFYGSTEQFHSHFKEDPSLGFRILCAMRTSRFYSFGIIFEDGIGLLVCSLLF